MLTKTKECVIFDLDGVLADVRHRLHYLCQEPKHWERFFAASVKDPVFPSTKKLYMQLNYKWDIFIFTARPNRYRMITEYWLRQHGFYCEALFMCPDELEGTSPHLVKKQMLKDIRARKYEPIMVFEDSSINIAMFRAEGITCFQLPDEDWVP